MKFLMSFLLFINVCYATMAYIDEVTLKQSDGTRFKAKIKGDEWFNWVEDKSGNIIKYNKKSKNYEYGKIVQQNGELDLVPSGIPVKNNPNKAIKATPMEGNITKIDKKLLYKIWKSKREKALSKLQKK